MPKIFATENANKVPANALWLTNIVVQLFVITTYWSRDAFTLMLEPDQRDGADALPARGRATADADRRRGETYDVRPERAQRDLIIAGIAVALHALHVLSPAA